MHTNQKKRSFFLIMTLFFVMFACSAQSNKIIMYKHREPSNIQEKSYYSCRDVLLNAETFNDVGLNMIWTYVYTLCTMEMGMQTYIQKLEKNPNKEKKHKDFLLRAKGSLLHLQKNLTAYLEAFRCAIKEFSQGQLRKKLDKMKLDYIRNMKGNGKKSLIK